MEKITVREFRKNLSSYLVRIKQGESFTVNGVHITQVIAFAEASCTHATSEETTVEIAKPEEVYTDPQTVEKELKKSTKGKLNVHKDKNGVPISTARDDVNYYGASQIEIHTCEKCKKPNNECYRLWEEGEERIVCIDCIKKSVSPKMLKSYLRKLNKL